LHRHTPPQKRFQAYAYILVLPVIISIYRVCKCSRDLSPDLLRNVVKVHPRLEREMRHNVLEVHGAPGPNPGSGSGSGSGIGSGSGSGSGIGSGGGVHEAPEVVGEAAVADPGVAKRD
jgi:uncharacterized membrane protein YgcG